MLKKVLALILAAAILLSLSACKLIIAEKYVEAPPQEGASPYDGKPGTEGYREGEEPEPAVPSLPTLSEDDPEFLQIMKMYNGVAPLGAYNLVYPGVVGSKDMSPDDFWLLMAIAAKATAPVEYFDASGNVDLPMDQIDDYAETFFPKYYELNGIPSFKDSYAASADPKGTVVTLLAMSIDSYEPELVGFWRQSAIDYVLVIDYRPVRDETQEGEPAEGEDETDDIYIRQVAHIAPREDQEGHQFAFTLVGFGNFTKYTPPALETPQ